jgi:hypothetical protein
VQNGAKKPLYSGTKLPPINIWVIRMRKTSNGLLVLHCAADIEKDKIIPRNSPSFAYFAHCDHL